jgi:hypothetical protein
VNGADELANALSLNETATSLCLWLNHMGDEVTGKAVVHCVLVVVTQSHCFLRQGIEVLAPSLASHPCLVKIDLFDNNIGDAGAAALAQVLIKSSTIQVINLQENMIGDQGAEHCVFFWRLRNSVMAVFRSVCTENTASPARLITHRNLQVPSRLRQRSNQTARWSGLGW